MSRKHGISRQATHQPTRRTQLGTGPARRRLLLFVWISAVLVCALPALAAKETRSCSVLAFAPGLEKRVTYSETKISLGELVARVASETGAPLTAASDVADEPVAVVVTDFPARELLEQLADLLDYQWSRRPGTSRRASERASGRPTADKQQAMPEAQGPILRFEIWQDLASKQREQALRQALYAAAEQRFQEELALSREFAGKSQEEMRDLWDEAMRWNARLEKLTLQEQQALVNTPEGRRQNMRASLATKLWSPIRRSLAGWMARLSPEQWAALRAGRQLSFSSDPQQGKPALPPDVLRVFRTSRPALSPPGQPAFPGATPEAEDKDRQWERRAQELWDQAEEYTVTFWLRAFESRWGDTASIQFGTVAEPFRGGKRIGTQGETRGMILFTMSQQALPLTEEDPGRRARLEQDPVLSVKKTLQPNALPYVDPLFPGASRTFRLLPELLPELARVYNVNFIADSYWTAPNVSDPSSTAGPRPLFEVLDGLNSPRNNRGAPFNWDRRDGGAEGVGPGPGLIRIRNRRWFVERPREVPLRHVRRWIALTDRLGALPLNEFLAAATTLTDVQVDTLEDLVEAEVFPPQLDDLRRLAASLSILRLYARLSPAQRRALQAGQLLGTARLSPALRPFILAQLSRAHFWSIPRPGLEEWNRGHITLSRTPDVRIREQRGRSVTWRLASVPAPRGATPPDTAMRFPVTRLRFEIDYGGETPEAVALIVAAEAAPPE